MNIKVIVFFTLITSWLIYSFFVYTSGTQDIVSASDTGKNSNLTPEKIIEGKLLYQQHNCTSCHQLYGLGGYLGPELTRVISQEGKGELYARTFLTAGGPRMPNFHFKPEEIEAIIEFLKYVDETAITYKNDSY